MPNSENNDTINTDDFEVIYDGESETERNESSGGDGGRSHRVVARKSGSSVQSRTAKTQARTETQKRRAKSIKNNVNAKGVERVSTASQGISLGTNNPTLQVVPRNLYTEEMKAVSKEQFAKGRVVTFFVGQLEMEQNGETFYARGALSKDGKRMWIQANHPSLTIEQIAKHEEFHALVKKDSQLLDRTKRQIIAQYSEAELQALVDNYIDTYAWTDLTDNEILEEVLADAYAEIDVFDYLTDYEGATRFSDAVQESAKSVQDTPSPSVENNTGQERFSRNRGTDFLISKFSGRVNDTLGILTKVEFATISINIKSGEACFDTESRTGGVFAHDKEFDWYYVFEFNSDGSVSIIDVLDPDVDYATIDRYERGLFSEKFSRETGKEIARTGMDGRTYSLGDVVDEKAVESRDNIVMDKQASLGDQSGYKTSNGGDSKNGRAYNKQADTTSLTEKFSRDSRRYDYDTLVAKDDIELTVIDDTVSYSANSQTRKQIVKEALKNAATIGKTNSNGGVSVYVEDIGADVILAVDGLRHGLDRRLQKNAAVTLKAGEILKNSIQVNELTPKNINASDSYVLIGVAKNTLNEPYVVEFVVNRFNNTVASVDVLYSMNTKNESAVRNAPGLTGKPLLVTDSKISVSQLLDLSIDNFPDVLSESVLRHYGYEARPDGKIGESALFSRETVSALQEQEAPLREQLAEVSKEAERAKKQAEYWKGQTKRTLTALSGLKI